MSGEAPAAQLSLSGHLGSFDDASEARMSVDQLMVETDKSEVELPR